MGKEGFYKLLLIGDSSVGKSSILHQYVNGQFRAVNPTVGVNVKYKTVNISGEKIKLQIRDLAGQENIHYDSSVYYKGIDGIMLVFDITNQESFTHIRNWFQQVPEFVRSSGVQMLLIGNKCDVSSVRAVSSIEAEKLTSEYLDDIPYIEISAKTGQCINGAFELMIKKVLIDPEEENIRMIVQSLKQAKEKQRTVPVTFLKVFLTGSAAAGKTSFSHLLLKKKMNENHESTDLVCASHIVSMQKAAFHATEDNEVTWVELNPSLEIHYLRSFLVSPGSSDSADSSSANNDQTEPATEESDGIDNDVHDATFLRKSIDFFWYVVGWFTLIIPSLLYPANQPIEQSTLNDDKCKVPTATAVNATSNELHEKEIDSKNLSSFKYILQDSLISDSDLFVYMQGRKLNIITILDTGGQPQYIHLLPAINIHPTVNFVIHDLSKNLNDQVQVEYNKNGKQVVSPYHVEYSYLNMIKLLMSAVNDSADKDTSYGQELKLNTIEGADNDSCLCLVGTHKDKVGDEVIKGTATTLTTLVNDMKCKATVWRNEDETVLFAVDNTTAGSEKEDYVASVMRKNIEHVAANRDVHEVPITWMLLELEIKKFCEQNSKAYISFEDCFKLARNSGLISSDEELKNALNYHHFLGVLLYFKDIEGLCNYIIIDHQWWFDKLSSIICLALNQGFYHDAVDELKYQGKLSKKLLEHIPWDKNDIEKRYLISLLYHMKIIACLDIKNETYFIPFVLPTYNPQESETLNQYGNIQGKPLLLQFYSGLLPRGFFCSLVVHLLRLEGWQFHTSNDRKKHRIFNNMITFCLPDAFSLLLFDKVNYLELHIRHRAKELQSLIHYKVYRSLVPVLEKVCKHLKLNIERLRCGFLCPCKKGSSEDHIAFLPDSISELPNTTPSERFATCVKDSTGNFKITALHKSWFSQLPLSSDSDDCIDSSNVWTSNIQNTQSIKWPFLHSTRPLLADLQNHITSNYAAQWIVIGIQLGIPSGILQGIQASHPTDAFHCCNMMLERWLDTDCNASWGKVYKAVDCPAVTKAVKNFQVNEVRSLKDIEADFENMVFDVQKAFIDGNVVVDDLLINLKTSFATKKKEVPLFREDYFKDVTSIETLFKVLDCHWNLCDHDMLAFLINMAKCEMASVIYQKFVNSVNLSPIDLVCHCPNMEMVSGYKTLQVTININECTIKTVEKIKMMIVEYYELEKHAIVFKEVLKGSINIKYLTSDLVMIDINNKVLLVDFKNKLILEEITVFNGMRIKQDVRQEDNDSDSASNVASNEKRADMIKPEDLKFTASELKDNVSDVLQTCRSKEYVLKHQEGDNVRLLLMTVNDNEFYAVLYYMSNKHIGTDFDIPKSLTADNTGTRYFVGTFAQIPTALVQHAQGSSESQFVVGEAMKLFANLKAIIAVGVCGTFGELGDVIVSSKIAGYMNIKYDKDGKIIQRDSESSGSRLLSNYLLAQNDWKFNCTKESSPKPCLSQVYIKPFLSSSTLVAYQDFRDKIREDVCREAMGIEMEGIGIVNAKEFNSRNDIHFIIVKAGCDYANETKNKEWQPVAAMAAADLVYFQLDKPAPYGWFTGKQPQSEEPPDSATVQEP